MSPWILIIMMAGYGNPTVPTIQTQQFLTQETCEAARVKFMDVPQDMKFMKVWTICVRK